MSIRADVEHFFEKYPNEKHFLKDIAQHLGLEERPVQQAISWMVRHNNPEGIEVVHGGQCWIYHVNNHSQESFTKVDSSPRGILLKDSEGNYYLAKKVDM